MRDEGLEIKAIKKILEDEDKAYVKGIKDPPPVIIESDEVAIIPNKQAQIQFPQEIAYVLDNMKVQIFSCIIEEVAASKEHFSKEIVKNKLELGACVENGFRKLESKMDRHFQEVDNSLNIWRSKHKRRWFSNLFRK
jgi:hypothetical protein